jgi:prepilin-type N-terminal cleavage/methylation domain-containing protein/prepilin-type processing-associated H-X9-DG protein
VRKSRAFTLVEILVVIGILVALMSLASAMIRPAKRSAKEAVTISNLRQCSQALLLYMGEETTPPAYDAARRALTNAPIHDDADYWKLDEKNPSQPMIGSYAYAFGVRKYQLEAAPFVEAMQSGKMPWFAALWHGDYRSIFVPDAEIYDPKRELLHACQLHRTCIIPNRANYAFMDGSVRTLHWRSAFEDPTLMPSPLVWEYVFEPHRKHEGIGTWR